jgi:patatin-like phospholipase
MPPAPDPALPLCDVLEAEYAAITGAEADPPPSWEFTAEQILEPERLASRLIDGHDRAARELALGELGSLVAGLRTSDVTEDRDGLRRRLVEGFNALLHDPDLYAPGRRERFAGIRFRSQTVDRIGNGNVVERNRLILEDTFFEVAKLYDIRLEKLFRKIHRRRLSALCFSGGGIRSATFGLGVLQGLARHGLLDRFHYLSTVSGGGYLGGWLSAWISHTSLSEVIGQLRARSERPLEPEPTPIWHLRTYSNYLSPKLGLLSADSWTLVATYVRNLFLNWLVLIPALIGVLSLPFGLIAALAWAPTGGWARVQLGLGVGLLVLAFGLASQAVRYVHQNRPVPDRSTEGMGLADAMRGQRDFLTACLLPLVVAVVAAVVCWSWASRYVDAAADRSRLALGFALLGGLVHLTGWGLAPHRRGRAESAGRFAASLLVEG